MKHMNGMKINVNVFNPQEHCQEKAKISVNCLNVIQILWEIQTYVQDL